MRKFVCAAFVGVAAIVASAVPADATVFTISYYGTADIGPSWPSTPGDEWPQTNVNYSAVFTIDNSMLNTESDISDTTTQIWHIGPSVGIVSAVMNLDGIGSFALGSQSFSMYHLETLIDTYDSTVYSYILSDISDDNVLDHLGKSGSYVEYATYSRNVVYLDLSSYENFDMLHPVEIDSDVEGRAEFGFSEKLIRDGRVISSNPQNFMGIATINRVVVSLGADAAPAVPEPATWAMMIGGFGLVGVAMRRRSKAVAALA